MSGAFSDYPMAIDSWPSQIEFQRMQIRTDPSCRFVSWADYCKLLVSNLRLERTSNISAKLAGLREPATGVRYFIELEKVEVRR